ncbi:DUF6896 domain-containing protein [Mucilaginibacter sp.]
MLTIEQVIDSFQQSVREVVQPFYDKYKRKDLLRAWKDGMFPQLGSIGRNKLRYFYHGIGLKVYLQDRAVDFNFGNGNRIDGFDEYRLLGYLESQAEHKGTWTLKGIQGELTKLISEGKLYQLDGDQNYYKQEARHLDPPVGTSFSLIQFYTLSTHSILYRQRKIRQNLSLGFALLCLSIVIVSLFLTDGDRFFIVRQWPLKTWLIWSCVVITFALGVWQMVMVIKSSVELSRLRSYREVA